MFVSATVARDQGLPSSRSQAPTGSEALGGAGFRASQMQTELTAKMPDATTKATSHDCPKLSYSKAASVGQMPRATSWKGAVKPRIVPKLSRPK